MNSSRQFIHVKWLGQVLAGFPALAWDLEQTVASARILEPDVIFVVVPWSATETINRCAEALAKLPCELHLGAEHILDRFAQVELSKFNALPSRGSRWSRSWRRPVQLLRQLANSRLRSLPRKKLRCCWEFVSSDHSAAERVSLIGWRSSRTSNCSIISMERSIWRR